MPPGRQLRAPGSRAAGNDVRRHNLALVLCEVVDGAPVSRAAIAGRTGLTRGTVSSLVAELVDAELLTELDAARGGPGRPANPLQLNRSGPAGLGVEIGVDHVAACVVDLTGAVRVTRGVASDHRDAAPAVGLARAAGLARAVVAEAGLPVAGVGLALPGLVGVDGTLQRAPNLPRWVDVAAGPELSDLLGGLPVTCGNEADLAALAELRAARGPRDFVYVSGGIGVGAGIVLDGRPFRGAGGRAGELGHVVVDPDGPACRCGGRGCLERYAGRDALAAGGSGAAEALAVALTAAVHLLDVPAVVLGGDYPALGEVFRAAVATALSARVRRPDLGVRFADPHTGGALRGAAAQVVHTLLAHP